MFFIWSTSSQSWQGRMSLSVDCCDAGFYRNHINVTFALMLVGWFIFFASELGETRRGAQIRHGRGFIWTSPLWRVMSVIRPDLNYSYRFLYWRGCDVEFVDWLLQGSWIPLHLVINCGILQVQHLHKRSVPFSLLLFKLFLCYKETNWC